MQKSTKIVLVILFAVSVTFAGRVLRDSTASNLELFSVFASGILGGLLIGTLVKSRPGA